MISDGSILKGVSSGGRTSDRTIITDTTEQDEPLAAFLYFCKKKT